MIEYHEPGFVCCNSLNPCEKHEKKPPAQSDAPSADPDLFTDEDIKCLEEIREESRGTRLHERIAQRERDDALDALGEVGISNAKILSELSAAESALSEARTKITELEDIIRWDKKK